MKAIVAWGALMLLGGCSTYSLEELRHAQPTGNPFQQALAREYLSYASDEERNYDWADSWHFADKGLIAAYGNDVAPEVITDRSFSPEMASELEAARDDLLSALTPAAISQNPLLAARAYMQFDCWVERAEDGWETTKIEACKQGFLQTLSDLKNSDSHAQSAVDTTSYLVFFEWNRATLNAAGQAIVDDVAQSLSGESSYEIILNGHTDSAGLEKFNLKLSKKRAEAVAAALVKAGIDGDRIQIFAFGESDPVVATADGAKEAKNRRVEIFIQ